MNAAVLRIFSGLHLGAEIELIEGVYVIGTDDSCDLILSDSSLKARHAALRVSASGDAVSLSAEPLDGPVTCSGASIDEESGIAPLAPFQLGLLTAAWIPGDAPDRAAGWAAVEERISPNDAPKAPTGTAAVPEGAGTEPPADIPAALPADGSSPELSQEKAEKPLSKRGRGLFLAASVVLAGALCFGWHDSAPDPTPAQLMRSLLDEAGYDKLNVVPGDKSITVTGRIATDQERGRLLRLAQLLKFPVYLEVTVHSDAADAVRASFNTLGLWPEVTELPPSARPGVRVRGYIRNGFLEEMALSTAVRNVPALRTPADGGRPSLEIFRHICHEDEVAAELEPALMAAGLDSIQKVFLPGRIELRGTLTPQSKAALADAAKAVVKKLGVPIPFDIINEAEEQKPKANIYTNQGAHALRQEAPAPAASTFKVISVSMGALKFVTLESGERIFEGGELPGGYMLERIGLDALTLTKNSKTTQYPLRGSSE